MAGALPLRLQRARQIGLPRADGVTLSEDYVATRTTPRRSEGILGSHSGLRGEVRRSKGPFPGLPGRTNPPNPPQTFLVYFHHHVHRLF